MAFDLLSSTMQKKIWDKKWKQFTPIQDKAIPAIIETDHDVIISSGTASGKTEAAFLPILSKIEKTAGNSLKVLYISPLKALINNQFERIEDLCDGLDITIHRWHGDVSQNKKKKFAENPTGILQITPESIESLFINRTGILSRMFQDLEFIVLDEIHSFLDNERGVQLRSLLSRLEAYTKKRPRYIGLSATIDNFEYVKEWVNFQNQEKVNIIQEAGDKGLQYHLMHFQVEDPTKMPLELFEDIRELTRDLKAIIFCNSRGLVEEMTVMLNRLAEKEGIGETYYPHHSSVDKKEREFVEKTIATSNYPKSVVATSSLELGIDIGSIDIVIQVDSTFSVSSLRQRLGRSGRKQEADNMLQLYSTSSHSLLQSIAVMELALMKWVEPAEGYLEPFDVLFHQIISICHQFNGIQRDTLIEVIKTNASFHKLERELVNEMIDHMIEKDQLEELSGVRELIVGLEGERLLRSKDFYAVFMTKDEFEVVNGTRKIGTVDKTPFIKVGDRILLAGKVWQINEVDVKRDKLYVTKAPQGARPKYAGMGGNIHERISQMMMEIRSGESEFSYIDDKAEDCLNELRTSYHQHNVQPNERIGWKVRNDVVLEMYTGTKIFRTFIWMLRARGAHITRVENGEGEIYLNDAGVSIDSIMEDILTHEWTVDEVMKGVLPQEMFRSKFAELLPDSLVRNMHIANVLEIERTLNFLRRNPLRIIELE